MTDHSELIERLEAEIERQKHTRGDYLDYGEPDPLIVEAATAIRDLITERDTAHAKGWNEAIEAAARLIAADDSPVDWCDAYPAIRAMRKDTPQ